MDYVHLGSTGLRVSTVGLGCGNFGGVGSAPEFYGMGESEEEAFALMDRAVELGINYFDTADAYGGGRSEEFIGKWLTGPGSEVRDQVLISSKVFNPVGEGPNDRGLSRRHLMRQVEASMARLGVDHLDMYLMHEPDPSTPIEETLTALDDLVRSGKVHYLGASNMPAWLTAITLGISERRGLHRFGWIQNSYSLLDRDDEVEMFPLCLHQGLGYTPFSPLAGGMLTGKYGWGDPPPEGSRMTMRPEPYQRFWNPETFEAIEQLKKAAADRGVSTAGLALAWVLSQPVVTSVIVGPRRLEHFRPVEEALDLDLSAHERDEIGELFGEVTP